MLSSFRWYNKRLSHFISDCWKPSTGRKMSECSMSFVQQFNHVCSKMEWKVVSDDYDYNQEIATSCYGDMLHDTERNQKFGLALKKAIGKMHSLGRKAHVLDIGTGTGLLSMLAVKYGADSVVACEAFLPMANCAVNVIEQNGLSDKIKVIKKHSTSLTIGDGCDVERKANILVSEVFDTELIGEGAIKTFNHAHKYLLEDDCIVIPSAGTIYAQVVESDLAAGWNCITDWEHESEELVKIPGDIRSCPGAASVHDIQLSQFKQRNFKSLTEVVPIFRFDWSSKSEIPTNRRADVNLKCTASGKAQIVFMWWDLEMDPDGEILLSCAPVWSHPDGKGKNISEWCPSGNPAKHIPWRDHWMQAVYFLAEEASVVESTSLILNCYHDEFSFWFKTNEVNRARGSGEEGEDGKSLRPVCNCGIHFSLSRTRIGAINDPRRRDVYLRHVKELVRNNSYFVVLGDMTFLGYLVAKLGARKVDVLETSPPLCKAMRSISEYNALDNLMISTSISDVCKRLSVHGERRICIVSEPFFRNSVLPWDNLSFWYMKDELLTTLKTLDPTLDPSKLNISPQKCTIRGCAVQFDDLWKIARRLNLCEGFNMKPFDDLIEVAKIKAEGYTEPQPLWEYPGIALTEPFTMFELDFSQDVPPKAVKMEGRLEFPGNCRCDGVAIWMDYLLGDDCSLSTGPTEKIMLNEYISWDMFERQGVHLFRNSMKVNQGDRLNYEVTLTPESGELDFNFFVTSDC